MKPPSPWVQPRLTLINVCLSTVALIVLLVLAAWVSLVYGYEDRHCRVVPLTGASGIVKAAKAVTGRTPRSMEEAAQMLEGKASTSTLRPGPNVKGLKLNADERGFTLTVTTECFFFRRSTQRYDWKEDAFSRAVLSSGKPPEE